MEGILKKIKNITVDLNCTLLDALGIMDITNVKVLIVLQDGELFEKLVSIGDIQRAILNGFSLAEPLSVIPPRPIKVATSSMHIDEIKSIMWESRLELIPVIDEYKTIKEVYFWSELFGNHRKQNSRTLNDVELVIMAGGKGTRLKPLTNIIPKPLIPFGNKAFINEIIDRFNNLGVNKINITVNYKAELIKKHIEYEYNSEDIVFNYVYEELANGTAASLGYLKGVINKTFIVTNCDIIIDDDFQELINFHRKKKNKLTAISTIKNITIPYGTFQVNQLGEIIGLEEKPSKVNYINSGIYVLEPELLEMINQNKFLNMTDLIMELLTKNVKVGLFPISEGSWYDVGEWHKLKESEERYFR